MKYTKQHSPHHDFLPVLGAQAACCVLLAFSARQTTLLHLNPEPNATWSTLSLRLTRLLCSAAASTYLHRPGLSASFTLNAGIIRHRLGWQSSMLAHWHQSGSEEKQAAWPSKTMNPWTLANRRPAACAVPLQIWP